MDKQLIKHLNKILEYLDDSEYSHYEEALFNNSAKGHIYEQVVAIRKLKIKGVK